MLRSKSLDSLMRAVRGNKVMGVETESADDVNHDQEDEVDRELRELDERVKKWLQESSPPASACVFTDDGHKPETTRPNTHKSKQRRHSVQETQSHSQISSTLEGKSCTVLYHPDFADWTACDTELAAVGPLEQDKPPTVLNLLGGAHTSISKLLNF